MLRLSIYSPTLPPKGEILSRRVNERREAAWAGGWKCTLLMMCITPFVAALSPSTMDAPSMVMFCKCKPQWEAESPFVHLGISVISALFHFLRSNDLQPFGLWLTVRNIFKLWSIKHHTHTYTQNKNEIVLYYVGGSSSLIFFTLFLSLVLKKCWLPGQCVQGWESIYEIGGLGMIVS